MTSWQAEASDLLGRVWDVAVVGGGPAGAMAALHIARGGRAVAVVERGRYPRDKVCGDGLIADSIRALDRAGLLRDVEARALESHSLSVLGPSGVEVVIPTRTLVVKRIDFDAILACAATDAGAVVARGTVDAVEPDEVATLTIRGVAEPLRARVAIIATGADIRLLAPLGMVERAQPSVIAIRRYVRAAANIDHLIFSFDRAIAPGYAWLFPLGGGEYNVGCGTMYGRRRIDLSVALDRFLQRFDVRDVQPIGGAKLRSGLTGTASFRAPNVLAIGETIGATFPLTGEGIGKAMETGERAAAIVLDALRANDLSKLTTFPAAIDELRRRYRSYVTAERWVARPWLTELLVRAMRRSDYAIRCAEAVLNESGDPREIFSVRGVLRMLTATSRS